MLRSYPWYDLVPKDLDANLALRIAVMREAAKDRQFAAAVKQMCAEDPLFYMNMFGWTYDPRDTRMPRKPFITYTEFQDEAIDEFLDAIDRGYDVAWPKSRTMGASWMGLFCIETCWHFRDDLSFLAVSRNQDYVDQSGNPKSLFWKLDFIHANQPRWLLPTGRWLGAKDPDRVQLHLANADTGSVIDGESTTGDAGRGDRRTAMFIDEFAAFEVAAGFKVLSASRDTTNCRLFNSTPQGSANAFYDVVHKISAVVRRMHWSQHPLYKQGLYTSEKNAHGTYSPKLLDEFTGVVECRRSEWSRPKDVIFPEQYPFILDGKLRSPWYDSQCARCASPQEIAQELDIDFLGSSYQFFDPEFINKLIAEYCRPPLLKGRLDFDPVTLEPRGFVPDPKGPLELWFDLRGSGSLLTDRQFFGDKKFATGTDVSHGTGASNSDTAVVDLTTGRKVANWRDPNTMPDDCADISIALAKWFNNAFMIWDASGSAGKRFTDRLIKQKYTRIYYRTSEHRMRPRISDQPGYYLNPEDRAVLLGEYRTKLAEREYINQSEPGMRECLEFIVQPGGKAEHSRSANSQDPTGAREAHGDEVIADALASRALSLKRIEPVPVEKDPPWMSPAWRLREEERERAERERIDW